MKKTVATKIMAAALAVTTVLGVVPAKSAYAYYLRTSYGLEGPTEKEDTYSWNREYISKTFRNSEKAYVIPKNQKYTYVWGKNYGIDPNKFTWERYFVYETGGDDCYYVDVDKADLDFYSFMQNRRATIVALDDRVDELNKKVKAWNKPIIAYNKKVFAWDKKQSYYKEAKASEKKTWFQDCTKWTNGHPDLAFYKKDQGDFKHGGGYCPLMRYYLPAYKVKNGKLYVGGCEENIALRVEDLTNDKENYTKSKDVRFFTLKNTSDAAINTLAEQIYKLYFSDDYDDEFVVKMNKADTVKVWRKVQDYFFHKNQGIIPFALVTNPFHAKDENGKNYNVFVAPPSGTSPDGVIETYNIIDMSEYLSLAFKSAKENIRKAAEEDPSIISRCKDFEKWQSFADIKEPVNRLIMHNYSRNSTRYMVYKGRPVIALTAYLPQLWGMSCTNNGDYVITTYKGKKYIYDPYADKNELIPYTESKWKKLAKEQIRSDEWKDDHRTHRGYLVEE